MQDLQEILNELKMIDAADVMRQPALLTEETCEEGLLRKVWELSTRSEHDWKQAWNVYAQALKLGETYLAVKYVRRLARVRPDGPPATPPDAVGHFSWLARLVSQACMARDGTEEKSHHHIPLERLNAQERQVYDEVVAGVL